MAITCMKVEHAHITERKKTQFDRPSNTPPCPHKIYWQHEQQYCGLSESLARGIYVINIIDDKFLIQKLIFQFIKYIYLQVISY